MCQTINIADFDSQIAGDLLALIGEQSAIEGSLFEVEFLNDPAFEAELAAEEEDATWMFAEVEEAEAVTLLFEAPTVNESRKNSSAQAA